MWQPSHDFFPDLAPIIAQVLLEHPPCTLTPMERVAWALKCWPHCTREEAVRAVQICIEIELADFLFASER